MLSSESAYCFHDTGMRTLLKPAALTALSSDGVTAALPQAVSPPIASSELPRFQPGDICCASCRLVRSRIRPGVAGVPPPPPLTTGTRVAAAALESRGFVAAVNRTQYQYGLPAAAPLS